MNLSAAAVPALIDRLTNNKPAKTSQRIAMKFGVVIVGVTLMAALAQLKINLPFTPVPITGQTFGVALMALIWGRRLSLATIIAYLGLGASGLPLFANAQSGLSFGPTFGYLVGMGVAAFWMGFLADLGWTKSFLKTWLAALSGSVITFSFGCLVLSQFVGWQNVFALGVLPFLPGDFIKTMTAATIVGRINRKLT